MPAKQGAVDGAVAIGFEAVREAFVTNLTERDELGGAVAVWHENEPVVDLWGGFADVDRCRPWAPDTLTLVFSTTKGLAAAAMAVAHARGLLDYDQPVAAYWPEFAVAGKEDITIRTLLAHQAGLSIAPIDLGPDTIADLEGLGRALAAQAPRWEPGTRHGYHAFTLGWYESELIARTDPARRRLPQFFHDEVATPLGVDFYMGLPESEDHRAAELDGWPAWKMALHMRDLPGGMVRAYAWPWSTTARTLGNPRLGGPADFGGEAYRRLEFPAAVGFGTATGLAKVYGDLAVGGHRLGLDERTREQMAEPARPPSGGRHDLVLRTETSYALGWWRPFPTFAFGSERAFGTPGAGGSFAFADPETGIGFAYVTNRLGFHVWDDPRDLALREAVAGCLSRRG